MNKTRFSHWLAPAVTGLARGISACPGGTPNGAKVHPRLELEHWTAISDGLHNLTTDLVFWRGSFYLVHASSPWHIASEASRLVVWRSRDPRGPWEKLVELRMPEGDIRDPKFAVIHDRLFLYVLRNEGFVAEPLGTAFTVTENGEDWAPLTDIENRGWLFWRAKTLDGKRWYMPAYWKDHGKSILLASEDGVRWREVSKIYEGDHNDETDIEFLPDGKLLATARLEMSGSLLGHPDACTLVAVAEPPYTRWSYRKCAVTRLDGPNLFSVGGRVYAAGRHHPGRSRPGSFLGRKRTALYRVEPDGLIHLTDLPSQGDTGYPGVVVQGGEVYVCYYTNDIEKDYRWILGMFLPSEVRMARIPTASLEAL